MSLLVETCEKDKLEGPLVEVLFVTKKFKF